MISQPDNRLEVYTPEDSERKDSDSSAPGSSRQEVLARQADPNKGLCLLTRCNEGVQVCHLIPTTTSNDDVIALGRAWGMQNKKFHLDARCNLIFLRADWRFIFDQGNLMLIPQLQDLKDLQSVTKPVADVNTADVAAAWPGRTAFEYHLLPVEEFKKPICRLQGPESNAAHKLHRPPYTKLGVLTSHAQPHFVVVNTAQKLIARMTTHPSCLVDLSDLLEKIAHGPQTYERIMLTFILYNGWMYQSKVGGGGGGPTDQPGASDGDGDSGEEDDDDNDDYVPDESPDEQLEGAPSRLHRPSPGDAHRDVESAPSDSEDETAINDPVLAMSDDTAWIEEISGWAKECFEAASEGGWEHELVNDGQVVDYAKEDSLPAPPPESWDTFHPCFKRAKVPGKVFDTEQFTSNDWSVFMECSPLFGRGR